VLLAKAFVIRGFLAFTTNIVNLEVKLNVRLNPPPFLKSEFYHKTLNESKKSY